MLFVGVACDAGLLDTSAFRRAVATLERFRRIAIQFHKLRIVHIATERALNGL